MTKKTAQPLEKAANCFPEPIITGELVRSGTKCAGKPVEAAERRSTSSVIISRNKHWRYISSFHGPWLQLPPELLESLAHVNYASPRPHPIDPAVFFDIAKIRRSVDEATDLTVRAANGTTTVSQGSSSHLGNGLLGGGRPANSHARLSKERKHRMREMATQKLSQAYHWDEIAASVATMQSASSLEEVARLVLQKNASDPDAKYVDFFHEKIPSRMLDESTSLDPLDEVIRDRPTDVSLLRTRAVTKTFKKDLTGAVADLTKALAITRLIATQHGAVRGRVRAQNALNGAQGKFSGSRVWRSESRLDDNDQPNSSITQLLFHRAGVYFTLACKNAASYLATFDALDRLRLGPISVGQEVDKQIDPHSETAPPHDLEAKKLTRSYAKRALRDYTSFLAFFDYTPGTAVDAASQQAHNIHATTTSTEQSAANLHGSPIKVTQETISDEIALPNNLVALELGKTARPTSRTAIGSHPLSPPRKVYPISVLFAASALEELPPYPVVPSPTMKGSSTPSVTRSDIFDDFSSASEHDEAITYHPLLVESLHTLLLCHCLLQTSPKEHLRHAHMVARLTRICDGYPIFLAPRSPSRSDWTEVIRRTENWINLEQSWGSLCAPVSSINESRQASKGQNQLQAQERQRHEAVMESLTNERVHDEKTFHAAVASRELRTEVPNDNIAEHNTSGSKQLIRADSRDRFIGTERAVVIARWVQNKPVNISSAGKSRSSKKEEE
ncbi:MAG: hypothetical protein Q9216_000664 [Gyalolechia sp. 2 TL-2023]